MADIENQIREFILGKFPLARRRGITNDSELLESGIVDSLGVLDIVAFLEEQFEIKVEDDELTPAQFQSVACLTQFVQQKAGLKA